MRSRNIWLIGEPAATLTPTFFSSAPGPRTLCNACGLVYAKLVSAVSPLRLRSALTQPRPLNAIAIASVYVFDCCGAVVVTLLSPAALLAVRHLLLGRVLLGRSRSATGMGRVAAAARTRTTLQVQARQRTRPSWMTPGRSPAATTSRTAPSKIGGVMAGTMAGDNDWGPEASAKW